MSMTRNEVVALLKVATAYDGRQRGEADVLAWADSANRAGWTASEAAHALADHFTYDGGFLTPAVVTKRVYARREAQERAHYAELAESKRAEIESGHTDSADPERVRSMVDTVAERLGWQRKPKATDPARSVACPHCQAAPGRPCARVISRGHHAGQYVPLKNVHDSRRDAAQNGAQ